MYYSVHEWPRVNPRIVSIIKCDSQIEWRFIPSPIVGEG